LAENKSMIFGIVYGPPKTGKTLGAASGIIGTVPFTYPTGVEPVNRYGFTTREYSKTEEPVMWVQDWVNLATIQKLNKKPDESGPLSTVGAVSKILSERGIASNFIDDATILLKEQAIWLEAHGATGWGVWIQLADSLIKWRNVAFSLGHDVWLTCHEAEPKVTKNARGEAGMKPGGPSVPGYDTSDWFAGMFSFVAQLRADGADGWPYRYHLEPDPTGLWMRGSRHLLPLTGQWNLGAIRRIAGMPPAWGSRYSFFEEATQTTINLLAGEGFPESSFPSGKVPDLIKSIKSFLPKDAPERAVLLPYDEAVAFQSMAKAASLESIISADLAARVVTAPEPPVAEKVKGKT
jgi:hypothetical protein